jgi:hypothetical protein
MLLILGIISGIISIICYIPYIIDIARHKTKPERASWLIWTVLGSIAIFSQLAKGATNSLWMPVVQTLGVAVIFVLSLKYGEGGLTSRDKKALGVAMFGLILWYFTQEAAFALFITILVDAAGAILTLIKAYEEPGGETMSTWFLSGLSGLVAVFAVGSWDLVLLSYPVYIWLINWAVVAAMLLSPKHQ